MEWIWFVGIALLLGVLEVLTLDLIFLMIAGGALAAAGASALGAPAWAQAVIFALVALALLLAVRPWALRHLKERTPLPETGVAAHVGRPAVVVMPVTDLQGRVKLAGEVWTARSADPHLAFPVGADVQVVRIDGATAVVGPVGSIHPPV